jgi:hypothetical protein
MGRVQRVYVRGRCAVSEFPLSKFRVIASLLCMRVRIRQSFPFSEACFLD